jgi:hypothetical protein
MRKGSKLFCIAATLALITSTALTADDDRVAGVIVGRTGEVLHISVPHPVKEGAVFDVKLLEAEKPIAQARVLSCTNEHPYIALAKVVRADMATTVPTGVKAYTSTGSVGGLDVPKPMNSGRRSDPDRFSIQAGAFYPTVPAVRDSVDEYWESYRLNYSFLKIGAFDTQLSAEYSTGSGDVLSNGQTVERTMEVMPLTVLGRIKALRMGGTSLFLGAGGGIYRIRSEERSPAGVIAGTRDEVGLELAAGLESRNGWTLELRYRDVENSDIRGYSLALGSRF